MKVEIVVTVTREQTYRAEVDVPERVLNDPDALHEWAEKNVGKWDHSKWMDSEEIADVQEVNWEELD